MNTFSQLETGKRGLMAHQKALGTVAHNINNASTEGYSRQRVRMTPTDPLYAPGLNRPERTGQIGTGVAVARIERVRDFLLDKRILDSEEQLAYWDTRNKYLRQIDGLYQENDGYSLRRVADQFWASWQNLSMDPGNSDARLQIVERAQSFVDQINSRFERLNAMRRQVDEEIGAQVAEVNGILDNLGTLNKSIQRSLAAGDQPNDLLDRRDLLTQKLAYYLDISVDDRDSDEFQIHLGGFQLVQGGHVEHFALRGNPDGSGFSELVWAKDLEDGLPERVELEPVATSSGSLKGLFDLLYGDLKEEIDQLDELTMTYISQVNEIHRGGVGLNGKRELDFFEVFSETSNPLGNFDSTGDGVFNQTRLYQIGGTEALRAEDVLGIEGVITLGSGDGRVEVAYSETDTVGAVIQRINESDSLVKARLDRDGFLKLHAVAEGDFVLPYLADDSYFLTQYSGLLESQSQAEPGQVFDNALPNQAALLRQGGPEGQSASWQVQAQRNPSASVRVNAAVLRDPGSISAARPNAKGDVFQGNNETALAIAALSHEPLMFGGSATMTDFFAAGIVKIGEKEYQANLFLETFKQDLKDLEDLRFEKSGVNLDEEFTNMIKFRQGYNAAARFISAFDQLLDVLISQVGA